MILIPRQLLPRRSRKMSFTSLGDSSRRLAKEGWWVGEGVDCNSSSLNLAGKENFGVVETMDRMCSVEVTGHDVFTVHWQGILGEICSIAHHFVSRIYCMLVWEFRAKQIYLLLMVASCFPEIGWQVLSLR